MKRTEKNNKEIEAMALTNKELKEFFVDGMETFRQAKELENKLYGDHVYGNQTLSVEAKVDAIYTKNMIDTCYAIVRYDCIEAINTHIGGNVVDMTGTDRQVCRRFFEKFKNIF